jgi:hypothetical protein
MADYHAYFDFHEGITRVKDWEFLKAVDDNNKPEEEEK